MALFRKRSEEGRAPDRRAEDRAPLQEGQAALTPKDVSDRADAVESAAARALANERGGSGETLTTQDNLHGSASASETNAAGTSSADEAARRRSIAERAYYKAEQRGFAPGHEETDWLEAENEERGSNSGRQ